MKPGRAANPQQGAILVLNAGSSSLKFSLFQPDEAVALQRIEEGEISGIGHEPRWRLRTGAGQVTDERSLTPAEAGEMEAAIGLLCGWLRGRLADAALLAVGHRVVHGGVDHAAPVRVDAALLATLERLIPLAPLHQPHNLAAIRAIEALWPQVPQVACFDTAFHRSHSQLADLYALPWEHYVAGVRRYGFHGLSCEYIADRLHQVAPAIAGGRVIVAHLGSGASLCALRAGRSIDSTMGFSPLDGLPMGSRCGAIDPGVLLYLAGERGMSFEELERLLYRQSGLLGLSGLSGDMRTLLASSEPRAQLAVDHFVQRTAREIGALTAMLGGVDALVFTGGMGENSPLIRQRIVTASAWLGMALDETANRRGAACITAAGSPVSAWCLPTDEALVIARHTRAVVLDVEPAG